MADPTPTPPTADMQNLMSQLGAAAPNTTITGSPIPVPPLPILPL